MKTAMILAMAMLVPAGPAWTGQEPIDVPPTSAPQGGKATKAKTMTAVGAVKTVTADSLAINDGPGKNWTFVIDATTKIVPARTGQETIDVPPTSAPQGGKVIPGKKGVPAQTGQETIDVPSTSAPQGGKVIPGKPLMITDIKEGQRVEVNYHNVNGTLHAIQVRVM
jgi:hypothetical protein